MEEIRFEVCHPDGRRERFVVPALHATIGSGAHCDVRLAVDQAASEHVIVAITQEGLRFQNVVTNAAASGPAATIDGTPLSVRVVPQWALLKIGDTQVRAARAAKDVVKVEKTSPVTLLLRGACLLALPVALMLILKPKPDDDGDGVPALPEFALSTAPCPRSDPSEARVMADDQFSIAEASRERSPFAPQEGLAAVQAYGVAGACYRAAHDEDAANESIAIAKELRETTLLDARSRRLRLERMLRLGDDEMALQDVSVLSKLTENQRGPFVTWLADVGQQLKRQGTNVP